MAKQISLSSDAHYTVTCRPIVVSLGTLPFQKALLESNRRACEPGGALQSAVGALLQICVSFPSQNHPSLSPVGGELSGRPGSGPSHFECPLSIYGEPPPSASSDVFLKPGKGIFFSPGFLSVVLVMVLIFAVEIF